MLISYKWLKELMPGLKVKPAMIAKRLTESGLEVEEIQDQSLTFANIVVGQVVHTEKHPRADKLTLCRVTDGQQEHAIVCGASNVCLHKKYPLALPGAQLPNGMIIKEAEIRGVKSFGMLCSEQELGLADESHGIFELSDQAKVGQSFSSYAGYTDVLLDIAITPNRGDCLSHWGVAHEVGALFGHSFKPLKKVNIKGSYAIKDYLKVHVSDTQGCPRYCARVLRNISIGPSPQWLSQRLESLGVRSINNVVDATNYVMFETGHPCHAFDQTLIQGSKIVVRKAGKDLSMKTLDDHQCELVSEDLVIADSVKPIALAGIMGGGNSEISDKTTVIVLEVASFSPDRIRKTSRRLGLYTESSNRFERFVPPASVREAIDRLTALILEIAGGEASLETIDIYPQKQKKKVLTLRSQRLSQILGIKIPHSDVTRILKSLGFSPQKNNTGWKVVVPENRSDLTREIDIIEEVIRIYGIDKIPFDLPHATIRPQVESMEDRFEKEVMALLVLRGYCETIHYSFCDRKDLKNIGLSEDHLIEIQNPLSQELSVMRASLLPGLMKAYCKNKGLNRKGGKYFELRSIYDKKSGESKRLAAIYGGALLDDHWQNFEKVMDFYDGKGLLEELFHLLRIQVVFHPGVQRQELHPVQSVSIMHHNHVVGFFGSVHPEILKNFDIPESLYYFDLDYSYIAKMGCGLSFQCQKISEFPNVQRDLAILADNHLSYDQIIKRIRQCNSSWLQDISLFDLYEGKNIPEGKKSLTFSLTYAAPDRTLTDEEVNKAHFELVDYLKREIGVTLR